MTFESRIAQQAKAQLCSCFLVFFYFCPAAGQVWAQTPADSTRPAVWKQWLPDIRSYDPRVSPFDEPVAIGLTRLHGRNTWLRWQPASLQRKVAIDSTGQYITIREELFEQPIRPIYKAPVSVYYGARLSDNQHKLWQNALAKSLTTGHEQRTGRGGVDIDIPVPIKSRAFAQIFGGSSVGLNVQGDIQIDGGFRKEDRSEQRTAYNLGSNTSFKMSQKQRFTVTGRIGEKVTVNVDQDSERAFDFENNIKLNYTGFEDDILKKVEAGNIALSLPGTRYVTFGGTSAGLFGIKSEMQLGNLFLTAIASQEKGESKKLTASGGAQAKNYTVRDINYVRDTYFFLSREYRENFRYFSDKWRHVAVPPGRQISRLEVYVTGRVDDPKNIQGTAYRDIQLDAQGNLIGVPDEREKVDGSFRRLLIDQDYRLEPTLGFIRLTQRLQEGEALAVAYQTNDGEIHGDINYASGNIRLKLLRERTALPAPRDLDDTWHLEWKNVYDLGSRNIPEEGLDIRVYFQPGSAGTPEETLIRSDGSQVSYLNIFGLDETNVNGEPRPDNQIDLDGFVVNRGLGELTFPFLRPFDASDAVFVFDRATGQYKTVKNLLPVEKQVTAMYDTSSQSEQLRLSKFFIEVKSQNRSTTYQLGFNVIEGSEEVLLRGTRLVRDQDYIIDYFSGTLTVTNPEANKPDAQLEITYQNNQLFQLEKKSILGSRAEYRFNKDSFLGGTLLYLSERTLEQRVRLSGSEERGPMKNLVWDINTRLQFRPNFLSRALDALPLLSTQEVSTLNFEGEVAQIIPNPNALNNKKTGDPEGVAYVDDFEGTKRTTPLSVSRRAWIEASIPVEVLNDATAVRYEEGDVLTLRRRQALARRGDFIWWNPLQGIPVTDIYTTRETNAGLGGAPQNLPVLVFDFIPRQATTPQGTPVSELEKSWAGVLRALSPGYFDQTEAKFLEIWINGDTGRVHIDLGLISEDVIPNDSLNSEDLVRSRIINNILDEGEDIGMDMMAGNDPADFWDVNRNGRQDWGEPASKDDWVSNKISFIGTGTLNGTEANGKGGNLSDEGGLRPDTEDLNNNGTLDRENAYFSYLIDLNHSEQSEKYISGRGKSGWTLYRIPLADIAQKVGNPSLARVEYARIWIDGITQPTRLQLAEISLVSNEWKEVGITTESTALGNFKQDDRLEVTITNTEENPTYPFPPGVERETNLIQKIREKEQSQVLRLTALRPGETALAQKTLHALNFVHYDSLKMFVYGGKDIRVNADTSTVRFFLRFGADERNFYEFRTDVYPDPFPNSGQNSARWDRRNEMTIYLPALTDFKRQLQDSLLLRAAEAAGKIRRIRALPADSLKVTDYFVYIPNPGRRQEWRVRGNPSLTNIRLLVAGVQNVDPFQDFTGEVWMDELRVSGVQKDKGMAMRGRVDLKLADVANLNFEIENQDADFHNVATRFGSGDNTRRLSLNGNLTLDKFLPQSLGLSVPVSMSYSESRARPKYIPGSDILLTPDLLERFRADSLAAIDANSSQRGINVTISRRSRSRNFLIKNTLDNLSASYSYSFSDATNNTTRLSERTVYTGNLDYRLNFGRDNFIQPFGWIDRKTPLFGKLRTTKMYYTPQRFDARLQANNSVQLNQTRRTLNGRESARGDSILTQNYGVNHSFSGSMKIFENLTTDYSLSFNNLVKPRALRGRDSLNALVAPMTFIEGLRRFTWGRRELLSTAQTFNASYNPNLFSWMTTGLSYNATYRLSNSVQQRVGGLSTSVSRSISFNSSVRFSQLFQFAKRRAAPTPGGREDRSRSRARPGSRPEEESGKQPPGSKPEEQKGKGDTPHDADKPEKKRGGLPNPITGLMRWFADFKDVSVTYRKSENVSHNGLASDSIRVGYKFGFVLDPGPGQEGSLASIFRNYNRSENLSASSGFDLTRNVNIGLRFDYDRQRTITSQITGSSSLSWFKIGDGGGLPFPEWTLNVSGLEKLALFKSVASSVSMSTNFSGKKSQTWQNTPARRGITSEDFSISFRPLLRLSISWKNGMISSLTYNINNGYKPQYNINQSGPLSNLLTDEELMLYYFQSATFTNGSDLSITHNYSKRSGFRLPFPFLKNKELKNSVDLGITFNYKTSATTSQLAEGTGENKRKTEKIENSKTKLWSFRPDVRYSFSNRVQGGAHFEIGKNEDNRSGKVNFRELGININIAIRGN
ncbi:MAG: cell surface protein SprA [candidate division KSB1 bacterium]|nr:cell surface protein SprA [candidate division KSB1 bacterium]MDZ7275847.1 cell surface protein SprA [candidate division KSB1 bacterium]MDZ7287597.1 cell surface protein SprA [candidate division KSB1 bacterium]MDZ7306499.1 cell surface protein SprA [candidate division KSB1 bacterium]MDZ7350575.1 cell surface protein SprA [candidate division KSB1 bacterium]